MDDINTWVNTHTKKQANSHRQHTHMHIHINKYTQIYVCVCTCIYVLRYYMFSSICTDKQKLMQKTNKEISKHKPKLTLVKYNKVRQTWKLSMNIPQMD